MGTRGLYGFRKNNTDKTTYNQYDSYPDCLGHNILEFCKETSVEEMNRMFDCIELVEEDSKPTKEQIEFAKKSGYADFRVSTGREDDWYCLLRNIQGNLDALKKDVENFGKAYMIDNRDFIEDSLFCEYAYIINLDTEMLEFYIGFQKEPQEGNRYGEEAYPNAINEAYYPCKQVMEIPLNEIGTEADVCSFADKMDTFEP